MKPIRAVPAKAGTHVAGVRLPRQARVEINPMRIVFFDERNFPYSLPALDASFPLHRRFQRIVLLKPSQPIDCAFCGKRGNGFCLMFPDTPGKI